MKLLYSDYLMYSTLRLECFNKDNLVCLGTGFIFNFYFSPFKYPIPVLITNKHIIKDSFIGDLKFTLSDNSGNPLDNEFVGIKCTNFADRFIMHPDKSIDLCGMFLGEIINSLNMENKKIFYIPLEKSIIATKSIMEGLLSVEDVIMVGYPNVIWDEVNNKPIFRKGITATSPKFDYNGKKEFLIDLACFPGSSGSPVFIYNESGYTDKINNSYNMSSRIIFAGILRGGHEYTIQIDDEVNGTVETSIPNNLGVVIKAETIFELEAEMSKKFYFNIRRKIDVC